MATCGQCGQPVSRWQRDFFTGLCPRCRTGVTPVNLGCGTLIIIAIIVAVFSQDGGQNLKPEISDLQSVVQELKQAVDSQTIEIQELRTKIDELTQ